MPDHFVHTLTTFLKCVANVNTKISKSNFDLRGLDRKCRCAAKSAVTQQLRIIAKKNTMPPQMDEVDLFRVDLGGCC